MIANLMMYARPELEGAHNRFWASIRENLRIRDIQSPEELSQNAEEMQVWTHPELVLSQTCGMPYRMWLHDKVALVGTPDYGLDGCPPGYYKSPLIVRNDDPREDLKAFQRGTFAYNQTFSQSGYGAPYWHAAARGFWFDQLLHTEQHILSAKAVADGRADIASLDAVSWRLMQEFEGFAASLRVLEWTTPTPGLPLITSKSQNAEAIFDAVAASISQLSHADRTALGLKGIVKIPAEDYLSVPNPPAQ